MKTKDDFIRFFASQTELSLKDSQAAWKAIADEIISSVKTEERVLLPELGFLKLKYKEARKGANPATGEKINIAAKNVVFFKPLTSFKEEINLKKK